MAIEVELKARLTAPADIRTRLRELGPGEPSTYRDTYYDWPDRRLEHAGRQELRLRAIETQDGSRCLWTFKGAMLDAASTPEYETAVGAIAPAHAILTALGMEVTITYTKQCENFRFAQSGRNILATVVQIPEIEGTFLEIETLVPDDESTLDAQRTIEAVLTNLGLGEHDLEATYYVDLVREHRENRD